MCAVHQGIREVSTSHHARLVPSIVFDVKDWMGCDFLASRWNPLFLKTAFIDEGVALVELIHLCVPGCLPFVGPICIVDFHGFLPVLWHLEAMLASWGSSKPPKFHLVDEAIESLLSLGVSFQATPSWRLQHVVLHSILSYGDWIIILHQSQWFM